jgi:hypothetical protein
MTHIDEFHKHADSNSVKIDLYWFGWFDKTQNRGNYGLNVAPAHKTLQTLITTTYMFQSAPQFTIYCRPFKMTQTQFDYLQDHDLDTEEFLACLGPLPDIVFSLDLSQYNDVAHALKEIENLNF